MQNATVSKPNTLLLISHLATDQQIAKIALACQGYELYMALNGQEGLRLLYKIKPTLILLDLAIPDMSVEQLYRRIRNFTDTPILFLAEPQTNAFTPTLPTYQRTQLLTRPLSPTTLLAGVQQALTPPEQLPSSPLTTATGLSSIPLIVDHLQCQVILHDVTHKLSAAEYRLLCYFLDNAERTLSHQQLLVALRGATDQPRAPHLHTLIGRLRRKIEPDPRHPQHLITHYGIGYSLTRRGIFEGHR